MLPSDAAPVCFLQVHIQRSVDKLSPNSALFFEFKCNTARQGMGNSKAFCFIDWDQLRDLQPGKCALEVYRAAADFSRKTRPQLLSKKPLYLHLNAITQVA